MSYMGKQLVKFCTHCVQSNQRVSPSMVTADSRDNVRHTLEIDDGVCDACQVVAKKDSIDWAAREQDLLKLLDRYRDPTKPYDVLIPGSGGKDSVFQAHVLKTKYGMRPLTITWAPHMYTDVGWVNFQAWINKGGFDNLLVTPDGAVHRKLTRLAYENLLHPFQPFVFGQRHQASKLAKRFGIDLIFFGEHHAEYGAPKGEDAFSLIPPKYYTGEVTPQSRISGLTLPELEKEGIGMRDLDIYLPMSEKDYLASGIETHFLGHFLRWDPQEVFYYAQKATGFTPNDRRTEGTYSKYNSIDDKIDGFHYWCAFIKFGVGRCTHEASQEVRHRHITRDEALNLVDLYDGELPERYLPDVLEYMGLTRERFLAIADSFRPEHLWDKRSDGWWLTQRAAGVPKNFGFLA
ncbi:N-acetyl sugar amidotransferase [uncultured Ramlibacter sp.]|uniref:N-acetyl sugar amidotransferase n=1 Tax=uncultured Ramlibacter sp. TaxID=260755 RepID=UPI0026060360|nr:N-acetyl sugar amidotransferase [uncultured Ramlibacter sp.]